MSNNRLIFKTSTSDEVYYFKDSIFIKFFNKRNTLSTSVLNGGIHNDLNFVFNHHLSQDNIDYLENHDLDDYLINLCSNCNFNPLKSTGLVTLALMKNLSIVTKRYKKLDVTAITTAGVRVNAVCAGDDASYYEENGEFNFGTINTILLINSKLDDNVLAEAFMVASEAKSVALNNLKIPSQFSNNFATGTGTDGLVIASNLDSDNSITNAGKHSKLGELIGKSIVESIHVAIKKQVWITASSQSNVLVLLNRYKLDINEFYDSLNQEKHSFISQLKIDSKIQENIAVTSSILNLIDDVEKGILKKDNAYKLANSFLQYCRGDTVNYLLAFWIEKFLQN
ncbi:adenosylcobinamide amidohydrolase [uncultured Methanobrevibacter sp.]|uniref:adenosylcobinamide amidohydrolase n=1 Tax=uncultured Methanobrevibacter sp. TaxID=253161 RepID=UPI0025DAF436|nr:adenosylcobinamide amidohydrolase [uncultured Methanobrevibacter sp.]